MTRFDVTFRDYIAPSGWRLSTALEVLDITTEAFDHANNAEADGYSHNRVLAINPQARLWTVPIIAAHELAHIVLGHTELVASVQSSKVPKWVIPFAQFELEAHSVAKAVSFGLDLSDGERQTDLVQQYIDNLTEVAPPLRDNDAVRLARATLSILQAGLPGGEVIV